MIFSFGKKKNQPADVAPVANGPVNGAASSAPVVEPSPFEYDIRVFSDVGCRREINEDNGRVVQPDSPQVFADKGVLVLVADGMGGHEAGEVASGMAADIIGRTYYESPKAVPQALEEAFLQANSSIYAEGKRDQGKGGMGTTGTALVLRGAEAWCGHVGDSRLYLLREGQIYLMTEDHSAVMEMVKRGLIRREDARNHPQKNIILRAIGTNPQVEVAVWDEPFIVRADDRFLLCSDGLYDLVEDEEIRQHAVGEDADAACLRLIDLAKQRGGHDNITVALAEVRLSGAAAIANDGAAIDSSETMPETREVQIQA